MNSKIQVVSLPSVVVLEGESIESPVETFHDVCSTPVQTHVHFSLVYLYDRELLCVI